MCHIDPGRDKDGKQPQSLRRLLLLSWMATFLIGEYTLDDIANHLRQECREESCLRIIERYNQEAKGLIDEIEHVKVELRQEWQTQSGRKRPVSSGIRGTISKNAALVTFSLIELIM